jgi:hypothetical protein
MVPNNWCNAVLKKETLLIRDRIPKLSLLGSGCLLVDESWGGDSNWNVLYCKMEIT